MSVDYGHAASTNGSAADERVSRDRPVTAAGAAELLRARPEVLVGVAFAGGVLAAFLLRRVGR